MRKLFYRRGFCATVWGDERPSVHLRGAAGSGGIQSKEKFQRYSFTETHQLEAGQNAGRQLPKSKGIIEYFKEGLLSKSYNNCIFIRSTTYSQLQTQRMWSRWVNCVKYHTTLTTIHHHRPQTSIIHHIQKSNLILKLLFRECPQKSSLDKSNLIGNKITQHRRSHSLMQFALKLFGPSNVGS